MNEKICEIITKLSKESQNQKLRLFAKLDLNTKLEIFDNHKIIFYNSIKFTGANSTCCV